MIWWNIFTVLDVLLLFIYNQLSGQLGPKAVFFINNVIWFLGLDIYHLYFTLALWLHDVPSIRETPRRIIFYQLRPSELEPRRPEFEHKDKSNASEIENQIPSGRIEELFGEIFSYKDICELGNSSNIKNHRRKGEYEGGKPKGGFTGKNKTRESASFARSDFTYFFKKEVPGTLPTVSD